MFVVPAAPRNPRGKAFTVTSIDDDAMIVCSPTPTKTVYSPSDTVEKRSSSPPISTDKDVKCPPSPPLTPRRRAIFNEFWERNASSSSIKEDDYSEESGREVKQSPKLKPSYLGIYSFAPPSPLIAPKPSVVSPVSSTDSLTNSNSRPKSILRRHHSLRDRHGALMEGPKGSGNGTTGRTRSASLQLPFVPALYLDDASVGSRSSSDVSSQQRQHHSNVHFDPTITVREVIDEHSLRSDDSNWFSDNELGSFMNETINLCHSSAINAIKSYSLPSVAKAYAAAHEAGIKDPVVSCNQPEYRALFADPILHSTDEDAIVHDGSKEFFKIMSNEVQNVLIVDNSRTTLKLFKRHMLSMVSALIQFFGLLFSRCLFAFVLTNYFLAFICFLK